MKNTIAIILITLVLIALAFYARLPKDDKAKSITKAIPTTQGTNSMIKQEEGKIPPPVKNDDEMKIASDVANAIAKKYSKPVSEYSITVNKFDSSFAKGMVSFKSEPGGGLWFAAKTDKDWELAFDGNGIIDCETANKYNFPADMIPTCLDPNSASGTVQRQ